MSVGRICTREVHLALEQESISEVAQRMALNNVGCLVVTSDSRRPVGMITDRDITTKIIAKRMDANLTTVAEAMTSHPKVIQEVTPIEEAVVLMRNNGIRRLPVVNGSGQLVGLVCLDDVLDLLLEEFSDIRQLLRAQSGLQRKMA